MKEERIDIGGGHEIAFVSYRDDPRAALNDYHKTPDGKDCHGFISFRGGAWANTFKDNPEHQAWDVQSWEPLTLTPSLLCRACGDHGHITNGKWVKS
jgi:hypothetical protein